MSSPNDLGQFPLFSGSSVRSTSTMGSPSDTGHTSPGGGTTAGGVGNEHISSLIRVESSASVGRSVTSALGKNHRHSTGDPRGAGRRCCEGPGAAAPHYTATVTSVIPTTPMPSSLVDAQTAAGRLAFLMATSPSGGARRTQSASLRGERQEDAEAEGLIGTLLAAISQFSADHNIDIGKAVRDRQREIAGEIPKSSQRECSGDPGVQSVSGGRSTPNLADQHAQLGAWHLDDGLRDSRSNMSTPRHANMPGSLSASGSGLHKPSEGAFFGKLFVSSGGSNNRGGSVVAPVGGGASSTSSGILPLMGTNSTQPSLAHSSLSYGLPSPSISMQNSNNASGANSRRPSGSNVASGQSSLHSSFSRTRSNSNSNYGWSSAVMGGNGQVDFGPTVQLSSHRWNPGSSETSNTSSAGASGGIGGGGPLANRGRSSTLPPRALQAVPTTGGDSGSESSLSDRGILSLSHTAPGTRRESNVGSRKELYGLELLRSVKLEDASSE